MQGGCLGMSTANNGKIVIGMPLKNGANTLRRAVESILTQRSVEREILILIVNDGSTDNWRDVISDYLDDQRIIIENVKFGKTYAVRNFILDYIRKNIPDAEYIGRLDADDFIVDEYALSKIEKVIDLYEPDIIIAGNKQMLNNNIVGVNYANKKLLNTEFLKTRLLQMANGAIEGELPSCNVFVKPTVDVRYKDVESAEDHWYIVELLLRKSCYKIYMAEEIIYSIYTLNGNLTKNNRKRNVYLKSRRELYNYFISKILRTEYE